MKTVLITGVAGFIGFHLAQQLLTDGWRVVGVDSLDPYYDVRLKRKRLSLLRVYPEFSFYKSSIAHYKTLERIVKTEKPHELVHLAAQAGVRYSITNPWAYETANYLGTLNVFEAANHAGLKRVVYASSSSVYGANSKKPFSEHDRTDHPTSVYGASKKANELLAYSYHHLYQIEMIGLRFFTVYGRWGRPDLALFKFVKLMLCKQEIALYNRGDMKRSFTHVSDIVAGVQALLAKKPTGAYKLYNLGGGEAVSLRRFVQLIEQRLGVDARKKLLPMQKGDVKETVADLRLARRELGYRPRVSIEDGVADFVDWFKEEQKFLLSLKDPHQ